MINLTLNIIILPLTILLFTILWESLLVIGWFNLTSYHSLVQFAIAAFLFGESISSIYSSFVIIIQIEWFWFILLPWLFNFIEVWAIHQCRIHSRRINWSISKMGSIFMLLYRYFRYISLFWSFLLYVMLMLVILITHHLANNWVARMKLWSPTNSLWHLFECWVSSEINRIIIILKTSVTLWTSISWGVSILLFEPLQRKLHWSFRTLRSRRSWLTRYWFWHFIHAT